MAKKEESKIVLERTYNVPLRRRWMHVQKYRRAKKAVTTLRVFLIKHMKPGKDEKGNYLLKIGKYLNLKIWEHGIRNPPHHIKINATKDDKGMVRAELVGAPNEEAKEEKKAKKPAKEEKQAEKPAEKKTEAKGAEVKKPAETPKTEHKPAPKPAAPKSEAKPAAAKAPKQQHQIVR